MLDRARAWADIARHAPSGDNSQPWKVGLHMQGDQLNLTLSLDEATRTAPSLFDYAFVASFLSLGTYAHNFTLLAQTEGYALTDLRESSEQFTLTYAPATDGERTRPLDDVARLIRRRTTNRLPFKKVPLDKDTGDSLKRIVKESTGQHTLREFTGAAKSKLAGIYYALDQVRYRNANLYIEFMEKLRFGPEASHSRDGLRDTTLGAPLPAQWFLRLLRKFRKVSVVRALFFVGLEKIMALVGCLALIRNSASVFTLTSTDDTPLGWFRLGFCFESIWLELTRRNLAMQPLGTTLLIYRLKREQRTSTNSAFSVEEQVRLLELGDRFQAEFGLDIGMPGIAFRAGHGPLIENSSMRRPLSISN